MVKNMVKPDRSLVVAKVRERLAVNKLGSYSVRTERE
jgi:hypothetical protein